MFRCVKLKVSKHPMSLIGAHLAGGIGKLVPLPLVLIDVGIIEQVN